MNTSDGALPNVTFHLPTNHTDITPHADSYLNTAAYAINLLLGLPANSYVVWLIVTGAGSGVASEFFALNLSASEIIYGLSNVLGLLETCGFQDAVTDPLEFFTGFLLTGRPLFQCCICAERYLAVVHPVAFLKYRPLRYRVACSVVVWLLILGFSSFYTLVPFLADSILLAQYLFLFSVKSFCSLAVLRALKQPGPSEGGREREGENHMKKRAFRIILIILVSMLVNYMPIVVIFILQSFISQDVYLTAIAFCFSLTVVTGFVQPLLYLHRAGKLPFIRAP